MITIVNVDPNPRPTGEHQYELRINQKVIAKFVHRREDGLEKCLLRAANAASDAELARMARAYMEMSDSADDWIHIKHQFPPAGVKVEIKTAQGVRIAESWQIGWRLRDCTHPSMNAILSYYDAKLWRHKEDDK